MLVLLLALGTALSAPAIRSATVSSGRPPAPVAGVDELVLSWPFCPTDRPSCSATQPPAWVQLTVSTAAFSERYGAPHDDIVAIVRQSQEDLEPLVAAMAAWFAEEGIGTGARQVGAVHGLVKGIQYEYDKGTGWVEFPRYALEMLVEEAGDCDDAAILTGGLLEGLGYEPWLVNWDSVEKGKAGHVSTAILRRGDLAEVALPKGSVLVEHADLPEALLHVDGVGVLGGCSGRQCGRLGENTWHAATPPLFIAAVARYDAPDLATHLPLRMWRHDAQGNQQRATGDEVHVARSDVERVLKSLRRIGEREREQRHESRLSKQGLSTAEARLYLASTRRLEDTDYTVLTALSIASLGLLGGGLVVAGVRRRRRVKDRKERETNEGF